MNRIREKFRHFLNDKDGMTAKDFMLFISTVVFFLFISLALIAILLLLISNLFFGASLTIDPMYIDIYIELLKTISPVLMTITGGVFSVNVAGKISDGISGRRKDANYRYEESKQYKEETVKERKEDLRI